MAVSGASGQILLGKLPEPKFKAQLNMAGYSGTPLPQKLGIKPGLIVVTIDAPTNYRQLLGTIPSGVNFSDRRQVGSEFCARLYHEAQRIGETVIHLARENRGHRHVWVSWPKKSSGVATDVTEDVIRAVALPLGFVDIKVCAVDETWSGLKLMVRKNRKPKMKTRLL